jgi:hypothetical protein
MVNAPVLRDLLDHLGERGRLLVGQPSGRLVEQDEAWRTDDGAGDLDEAALGCTEGADGPLERVGETDELDRVDDVAGTVGLGACRNVRAP